MTYRYHLKAAAAALSMAGATLWAISMQAPVSAGWSTGLAVAVGGMLGIWSVRSALAELEASHAIVVAVVVLLLLVGGVCLYTGTEFGMLAATKVGAGVAGAVAGSVLARWLRLPKARVFVAGMIAAAVVSALVFAIHYFIPAARIYYVMCGAAFLAGAITAGLIPELTTEEVTIGQTLWLVSLNAIWFAYHFDAGKLAGEAVRNIAVICIGTAGAKAMLDHLHSRRQVAEVPQARATDSRAE